MIIYNSNHQGVILNNQEEEQDQIKGLVIKCNDEHVVLSREDLLDENAPSLLEGLVIDTNDHVIQKVPQSSGSNEGGNINLEDYYTKSQTDLKIIDTIIKSLGLGLKYDYKTGLINVDVKELNIELADKQKYGIVKIGNGIDVDNGVISLEKKYIDYLDDQLYIKPSISFNIQDFPSGIQDPGYSLKGQKEVSINLTQPQNINGSLTLSNIGSNNITINKDTNQLTTEFNIRISTEGIHDVTLQCIDIKNNNISSVKQIRTKFPIFFGKGSGELIKNNSDFQSYYTDDIVQLVENVSEYMWLFIPDHKSISSITANGFGVSLNLPLEQTLINNNSISKNYKCYRLAELLNPSLSYEFKIILK